MFRKTKIALALVAAPAAAMLAMGAGVASASSTPVSHVYSQNLAGYSTIFTGTTAFNDVRSDVTVPSEPASVPADSVAVGVVLQQYANGITDTRGFGLVWDDTTHINNTTVTCDDGGSSADQWALESGRGDVQAGTPLQPDTLSPIVDNADTDTVFCVPSGTTRYYVSIYDSTKNNTISYIAGALEPGDTLQVETCTFSDERYHEAGIGVDTSTGAVASVLTPGTLAGFWRDGLTALVNPSPKVKDSATNSRLTFDAFDMREFLGTADGTSSGTASLTPTGLSVGSAFNVQADT